MEPIAKDRKLIIGSDAFENGCPIPAKFTCDGENVSPVITVENIPDGTASLALIMDDPDAANSIFDHWIIWNIEPAAAISENASPGIQGKNGFGELNYCGPCPKDNTAHRYFFKVYALDTLLDMPAGSGKERIEKAMGGHVLARGEIVGTYKRAGKGL